MRIIHLILGKANPDRANGVNKVVHQLSKAQHKLGHQVEIWGITPHPEKADFLSGRPFLTYSFATQKIPFGIDSDLKKKLEAVNPETYFHIHGGFVPAFYTATRILKKRSIKFCLSSHGTYNKLAMLRSPLKKQGYFRLFEKQVLKDADIVHLVGESELEHLNKIHSSPNKWFFQNGMIPMEVDSSQTAAVAPTFGYCGRIAIDHKGLDILLEGFEKYKTELGGKGTLVLLGKGPDMDALLKQSEYYQSKSDIHFEGAVYGEAKDDFFKTFDAFLHTSHYEGMPTAVLEALGMAIPVIISIPTNLARFVEANKCGFILENNTAQEVAEAMKSIEKLKKSGAIESYRQNASQMIKEQFSWQFVAEKMLEKYAA